MPINCITCGASMPDQSEFCPACGRAVQIVAPFRAVAAAAGPEVEIEAGSQPPPSPPVIWKDRLFGAAAYLTLLPAVAFLLIKPYAHREFVRFHALQSILFWILAAALLGVGVLVSTFGFLLLWLFTGTLVILALSLTWLVLSIKALQGERFRLPLLGNLAAQVHSATS